MRPLNILLLLCLGTLPFGCSHTASPPAVQAAAERAESGPVTVAVAQPKMETLARDLVLSGKFHAYQVADLHAKVAGYLRQLNVDVGSQVKAGDRIAVLEIPEMAADVAYSSAERGRTEAEVARARVEIERAAANLELQRVSYTRLSGASKAEPGLIAQQEIDEALARRTAAEAQLSAAKAALRVEEQKVVSARTVEDRARAMAAYTDIIAPFSGVVTRRFADPGAMIQAGTASQSQAMPVVRLADIGRLRLVVTVPESAVPLVRVGLPVEIRVTSLNKVIRVPVSRVSRDVAQSSRTMEAEVDVANPGGVLTPGMYAEVEMKAEKHDQGLTVPVVAVVNSGGNRAVWIVSDAGVVEERAIKTGIETASSFEVLSGVGPGDKVIVSNRSLLKPGQRVEARAAGDN